MPKWTVTLCGDASDLETLASLGLGVTQECHAFVLRSAELESLTDANAVRQRAIKIVESINGIARIAVGDCGGVTVGGVAGDDGTGTRLLVVGDDLTLREYRPRVEVTDAATGQPIPMAQPTRFAVWIGIAEREPNVRLALLYFSAEPTPENLWNVYEVIRDDMGGEATGKAAIISKGWATDDQIDRFRSVHYPSVLGTKARHAVEPKRLPAPENPMLLPEAQAFITGLLERWLASKERPPSFVL